MPAEAQTRTEQQVELPFDLPSPRASRQCQRPANESLNWTALLVAAGFAPDDEGEDAADPLKVVQRQVSARDVPSMLKVWRTVPASVFELALKPVDDMHKVIVPAPPITAYTRARRVVRTEGVTRCTTVALAETAEWLENERQRRARQRPPRPSKQRFKLGGSTAWATEQK